MAEENRNPVLDTDNEVEEIVEPIIPPSIMLLVALLGIAVALWAAFTQQGSNNIFFWGGLGFALLSLVAYVLLAPQQFTSFLTGRVVRFGGTSILVTVVFIVALTALYVFVRERDWSADLTAQSEFSLTEDNRRLVSALGADPNVPAIRIQAFYDATLVDLQDQHAVLFTDIQNTSGSKITYEFIDIDRNPQIATSYRSGSEQEITNGQIFALPLTENGSLDYTRVELVGNSFTFSQEQVLGGVLRAATYGDYRAYLVGVDSAFMDFTTDLSTLETRLSDGGWEVTRTSFGELLSPESEITLNDPAADGEVLIIVGGALPLRDDEYDLLTNYLNSGGNLVIFAELSTQGLPALALDLRWSEYLFTNFGMTVGEDVVLDRTQALRTELIPYADDFSDASYITTDLRSNQAQVYFQLPLQIRVRDTAPANVIVTPLVFSSDQSYLRTIQDINDGVTGGRPGDTLGPFTLAASAENTVTQARVVLVSSPSVPINDLLVGGRVGNQDLTLRSIEWAARFNERFGSLPPRASSGLDVPLLISNTTVGSASFVALILLPFGILGIGAAVWANTRERARTRRKSDISA